MSNRRFRLPGDADAGNELLRRASCLQLTIWRECKETEAGEKGEETVSASYEICGDLDVGPKTAGGLGLLRDMLDAFERGESGS